MQNQALIVSAKKPATNTNKSISGFMPNVSGLFNKRGFKIPGWSDDKTIQNQTQANNPDAVEEGSDIKTGADMWADYNRLTQRDVNRQNDLKDSRLVEARTMRIAPYKASNATFLGQDASHLNLDPQTVEMAITVFASNLMTTGQWLRRIGTTSYQLNLDATGASTIGANVNFSMQPGIVGGTVTLPVLGFILRVTSYQGTLGQSGFIKFLGAAEVPLPTFQIQQQDASRESYVFIPAALAAMLNTNGQTASAGSIVDGPSLSQVADDKLAGPSTYTANTTLFTLSGNNAQIIVLPLFINDERAHALINAIKANRLKEYYDQLLDNAPALFAAQAD